MNRKKIYCGKKCSIGIETIVLIATIVAVFLGITLGIAIQLTITKPLSPKQISQLKFLGEMFIRSLEMIILPLVSSSVITSLANLDMISTGQIGSRAFLYYLTTTILAVFVGIVLVAAIKPGNFGGQEALEDAVSNSVSIKCYGGDAADTVMGLFRNMFPSNMIRSMMASERTCYKFTLNSTTLSTDEAVLILQNETSELKTSMVAYPEQLITDSIDILGVVVLSLIFGFIFGRNRISCKPITDCFISLEFAILKLTAVIIWASPVGILFLIASEIANIKDPIKEIKQLGMYVVTVLCGLLIHTCVTLMTLLIVMGRRNPLKFIGEMSQALLTALGTSSSSATMAITLKCLEEHCDIDERISRFMIPLGATVNMDGTALYEAVAAIYIAQRLGKQLNVGELILASLTATLTSVGAAGIPGAGLVTLVLIAIDIPPEYYIIIVPVDWLLDRVRTLVNVLGDAIGCVIIQRLCQDHLKEVDAEMELEKLIAAKNNKDTLATSNDNLEND